MNITNWIIIIYLMGALVASVQSFLKWMVISQIESTCGNRIKKHLILRSIAWPYYLFFKKNPIHLLSECLFSNYGNKGHTYFGSRGIKNFLNDLLKGRNRYKGCEAKIIWRSLDLSKGEYEKLFPKLGHNNYPSHVKIIYAFFKNKYLLDALYHYRNTIETSHTVITRFDLDGCERLDEKNLKNKLKEVCPGNAEEIFNSIKAVSLTSSI